MWEVRRYCYYPFFPMVAGRVGRAFTWQGVRFPVGRRVLLDLYATDRDPRTWEEPDELCPERFRQCEPGPFELVPQGGGEHLPGHRCPGEWITIAVMCSVVRFLVREVEYAVPEQDLAVSHRRMPTGPASGLVVRDVRRRAA